MPRILTVFSQFVVLIYVFIKHSYALFLTWVVPLIAFSGSPLRVQRVGRGRRFHIPLKPS